MGEQTQPLTVHIVAYAPTTFYHCTHCEVVWQETGFSRGVHDEQLRSALPPDLLDDYQAVSNWVHHLLQRYCGLVQIRVIDAASLEGAWKTLRHNLRRYPAVIVGGHDYAGTTFAAAEAAIEGALAKRPALV